MKIPAEYWTETGDCEYQKDATTLTAVWEDGLQLWLEIDNQHSIHFNMADLLYLLARMAASNIQRDDETVARIKETFHGCGGLLTPTEVPGACSCQLDEDDLKYYAKELAEELGVWEPDA